MSYPLLEDAPKDHHSEAFLTFLRANNTVVWENDQWLVIENCKYHCAETLWLTAFHKPHAPWWHDIDILDCKFGSEGYYMLIKPEVERSVRRFHVHLYQ